MLFPHLFIAGTFDRFHVGHQYLLWQGSQMCERLSIVVARDTTVEKIKSKKPHHGESERLARIQAENIPNATVHLGREDADFHATLREVSPDAMLFGYDQRVDIEGLQKAFPGIRFVRAMPYFPEYFKSSKFGEAS